jgi:hypothetical protein
MLGHKSASMTLDVYGHLWPSRLNEVADAMEAARKAEIHSRDTAPNRGPEPGLGM